MTNPVQARAILKEAREAMEDNNTDLFYKILQANKEIVWTAHELFWVMPNNVIVRET